MLPKTHSPDRRQAHTLPVLAGEEPIVTVLSSSLSLAVLALVLAVPQAGPESFDIVGKLTPKGGSAAGAVTVPMVIQIDRFTVEHERTKMTDGLKHGGYPGFLNALREAPAAGSLEVAGEKFVIRWAHQVSTASGRTLTFVTDQPVAFVGSGRKGAKSTAGYEVAVAQLTLDKAGKGTGSMAAAARVKPGGETGVRIDNYAEAPIALTVTARAAR
jgi:hypothetical protein